MTVMNWWSLAMKRILVHTEYMSIDYIRKAGSALRVGDFPVDSGVRNSTSEGK